MEEARAKLVAKEYELQSWIRTIISRSLARISMSGKWEKILQHIGTNGEIAYSLNSRRQYKDLFSLDARTGELRTKAILDYERFKDYQLEVTARDRGPDSIPTTSYVNVKVSALSWIKFFLQGAPYHESQRSFILSITP